MTDLISRQELLGHLNECLAESDGHTPIVDAVLMAVKSAVEEMPTVDAVPVNELLKLRDWLYESDGITMGGLRSLNELIAKYSNNQLPRIENGFERRR